MKRLFALGLSLCHCGPAPMTQSPKPPEPVTEPSADTTEPELPKADAKLSAELRRNVEHLASKIGERNTKKHWELASAADYLVDELSAAGYEVGRQGYEVDDVVAQNLDVSVGGAERGDEILVVGAHYDSAPGSPGADDNATGVAALLALARRFRTQRLRRSLRFVFFVNEEPPYFQTDRMGSLVYAKHSVARGDRLVGMLSLESLGVYSTAPGSQHYPEGLAKGHPTQGDFVAVVADTGSKQFGTALLASLKSGPVPAVFDALPADTEGVGWSDHWAFWQVGVPAVMLTDTAPYRYAHYHKATDTPDRVDYERLTHVVLSIARAVEDVANSERVPARE
ncbi:MAG: M28 family peptidase [Polyangiaceae bacterium]